jgi:hypothetical protein
MTTQLVMSSNLTSNLAPIALFVFKRPNHTLRTLTSLAANPEFTSSPLYIYCDGARNSKDLSEVNLTRNIVNGWSHPNKIVIEQDANCGLANSVITGVSELTEKYGQVIVVEDDLVVSKNFLSYLNAALRKYRNSEQVMQISAHMFPVPELAGKKETLFLPFISSWGWATWDRAWKNFDANATGWESLVKHRDVRKQFDLGGCYDYSGMLFRQMSGKIDSWAIRWNWSVFQCNGLVVYPPTSLVQNIGFDGTGTHCRSNDFHNMDISRTSQQLIFSEDIKISSKDFEAVKKVIKVMSGSYFVRLLKNIRSKIKCIKITYKILF